MRGCSQCKYNEVTCECIHCYRDLCDDCAEKGCCSRKPAVTQKFVPERDRSTGILAGLGIDFADDEPAQRTNREVKE